MKKAVGHLSATAFRFSTVLLLTLLLSLSFAHATDPNGEVGGETQPTVNPPLQYHNYKIQGDWESSPDAAFVNPEDNKATAAFWGVTPAQNILNFPLKVGETVVGQRCVYIDNNNTSANPDRKTIFVPLNSKAEWDAFVANTPVGVVVNNGCNSVTQSVCPSQPLYTTGNDRENATRGIYQGGFAHVNGVMSRYTRLTCTGGSSTVCPTWTEAPVGVCVPTNCPAQSISWTSGGSTCSANVPATTHATSFNQPNTAGGMNGSVDLICSNGTWMRAGDSAMIGPGILAQGYTAPGGLSCAHNAACGPANGVGVYSAPSSGLCAWTNPSAVTGSGPWNWTCSSGTTTVNCSAPRRVDGACGSANGQTFASAPWVSGGQLCSSGNSNNGSGGGPWTWSCDGSGGGAQAWCSASVASSGWGPPGSYASYFGNNWMQQWNGVGSRSSCESICSGANYFGFPAMTCTYISSNGTCYSTHLDSQVVDLSAGAGGPFYASILGAEWSTAQVKIMVDVNSGTFHPSAWGAPNYTTLPNSLWLSCHRGYFPYNGSFDCRNFP